MFRRSRLPPELREALRAPYRPSLRQRLRAWLRWAGGCALVVAVVLVAWQSGFLRQTSPLPSVVYGESSSAPAARVVYGEPSAAPAARVAGQVAVIDGDSLAMGAERLRIHGIDAPELGQTCERNGRRYACGEAARDALATILGHAVLDCEQIATDQYRRRIVRCRDGQGRDIGAELVRQGWALAFTRFSQDYVSHEREARMARRGLWAGSFTPPWDWRAGQRD